VQRWEIYYFMFSVNSHRFRLTEFPLFSFCILFLLCCTTRKLFFIRNKIKKTVKFKYLDSRKRIKVIVPCATVSSDYISEV
jgi:hypothetical protein